MDLDIETNTFKIFLTDINIDGETYKFFDVPKINDEKYCKYLNETPLNRKRFKLNFLNLSSSSVFN